MIVMIFIEKILEKNQNVLTPRGSKLIDKESLYLKNRTGTFCSQCAPGYSVVLGSHDCIRCSNWWLLTIIIYIIAGPLLVYLLYAFKLTLTAGKIIDSFYMLRLLVLAEACSCTQGRIMVL